MLKLIFVVMERKTENSVIVIYKISYLIHFVLRICCIALPAGLIADVSVSF